MFILVEVLNTKEQESIGETIAADEEDYFENDALEDEPMEEVSDDDYDVEEDIESEEEASEFLARLVPMASGGSFSFKSVTMLSFLVNDLPF